MEHIAIIGNGIAGVTTARHIRKLNRDIRITLISDESPYFFARTALMYVFMGHMRPKDIKPYADDFWDKNAIDRVQSRVRAIRPVGRTLELDNGQELGYDKLVIATGSTPRLPRLKGIGLKGVHTFYSWQDLERLEAAAPAPGAHPNSKFHAVIAGGGLIGVELAEMFLSRNCDVTVIVREKHYWGNVLPEEEGTVIIDHLRAHGVNLLTEAEVLEIEEGEGEVRGVKLSTGEHMTCDLLCFSIGVEPQIALAQAAGLACQRGVLVNEFLETSIEHIYAAGDCAELRNPPTHRGAVESVWYSGRMMGEALGATLGGEPTAYRPGTWFNSAKFFDIEYQIYGQIPPLKTQGIHTFYWDSPGRQSAIRWAWSETDDKLLGVHALGIRLRHEVADTWIREGRTIDDAIASFDELNFDAEFSVSHTASIITNFNATTGRRVSRAKRNGRTAWWQKLLKRREV